VSPAGGQWPAPPGVYRLTGTLSGVGHDGILAGRWSRQVGGSF